MPDRVGENPHGFFIVLQLARQQALNAMDGIKIFHFFRLPDLQNPKNGV